MGPVIIDVDGVLADFVKGFTRRAFQLGYGRGEYSTLNQQEWDRFIGMNEEQVSKVWENVKSDPFFWYDLPQLASVLEMQEIARLCGEREVYFATSRPGIKTRKQTEWWLENRGINKPQVIVTSQKGETAKAINASALIDDKAGNAVYAKYYSPATDVYVLDRPYNRFDPVVIGSKVTRVLDLHEFVRRVEKSEHTQS
jgi:uncharacterized HAD superfamily protein